MHQKKRVKASNANPVWLDLCREIKLYTRFARLIQSYSYSLILAELTCDLTRYPCIETHSVWLCINIAKKSHYENSRKKKKKKLVLVIFCWALALVWFSIIYEMHIDDGNEQPARDHTCVDFHAHALNLFQLIRTNSITFSIWWFFFRCCCCCHWRERYTLWFSRNICMWFFFSSRWDDYRTEY